MEQLFDYLLHSEVYRVFAPIAACWAAYARTVRVLDYTACLVYSDSLC